MMTHRIMTNQLTEELVHHDLADPPEGADVEDEEPDDTLEPTLE
jgi:hypothetical protein